MTNSVMEEDSININENLVSVPSSVPQDIDDNSRINHDILNTNADKIRLSIHKKSIWLYTGYTLEEIEKCNMEDGLKYSEWTKRANYYRM